MVPLLSLRMIGATRIYIHHTPDHALCAPRSKYTHALRRYCGIPSSATITKLSISERLAAIIAIIYPTSQSGLLLIAALLATAGLTCVTLRFSVYCLQEALSLLFLEKRGLHKLVDNELRSAFCVDGSKRRNLKLCND
jgi:hypothetical protein